MNQNTEYELFAQQVYQRLLSFNNNGLKTIKVQHDVKQKGESGATHQIDVYWEYEIESEVKKVIVECKNYSNPISIGKVRDFFGVLTDINSAKGIMATTKGFQSGAKQFADYYNIELKQLRKPTTDDRIVIESSITTTLSVRSTLFLIDDNWAKENNIDVEGIKRFNQMFCPTRDFSTHIPLTILNDNIKDSSGNIISNIEDLRKQNPDEIRKGYQMIFPFKDAYVTLPSGKPMKILEVRFDDSESIQEKQITIDVKEFVQAIITDAINGERIYV